MLAKGSRGVGAPCAPGASATGRRGAAPAAERGAVCESTGRGARGGRPRRRTGRAQVLDQPGVTYLEGLGLLTRTPDDRTPRAHAGCRPRRARGVLAAAHRQRDPGGRRRPRGLVRRGAVPRLPCCAGSPPTCAERGAPPGTMSDMTGRTLRRAGDVIPLRTGHARPGSRSHCRPSAGRPVRSRSCSGCSSTSSAGSAFGASCSRSATARSCRPEAQQLPRTWAGCSTAVRGAWAAGTLFVLPGVGACSRCPASTSPTAHDTVESVFPRPRTGGDRDRRPGAVEGVTTRADPSGAGRPGRGVVRRADAASTCRSPPSSWPPASSGGCSAATFSRSASRRPDDRTAPRH
jgi:hypothetical protein